jgi:hypothetical protein
MGNSFTTTPAEAPVEGVLTRASRWSVIEAPEEMPVSTQMVKGHCAIDGNDLDSLVDLLIAGAADYAMDAMECSLVKQKMLANFYDGEPIILPRGPILEVLSVSGRDEQATTAYEIKHFGHACQIVPTTGINYPVSVVYWAGYETAAAVPAAIRLAICQHAATNWKTRESAGDRTITVTPHSLEAFYRAKRRRSGIA